MLDTRSLVSALCLILIIGILLHFVNWRIHRKSEGAKFWTIGLAAQTLGLFMSLAIGGVSDPHLFFIYAVNLLLSSGHILMLYGTACFAERPFRPRIYLLLIAAMLAGYSWFALVDSQPMGRILVLAGILIATSVLSLSRLWVVARRDGPAGAVVLAAALGATVLVLSSLVALQLAGGVTELDNIYEANPLLPMAVLTLIAFETTTIFGYLLLSAAHSEARLRQMAMSDPLTGLANRRAFDRELARRIISNRRGDRQLALAVFDIDRFKQVNDTHGHDAGDEILRHIARTAAVALREGDLLARIGGEEFAVIPATSDPAVLEGLASRLRGAIEASPAPVGTSHIAVTVSVGCALAECHSAADIDRLFKAADTALYAAKTGGRNRVEIASAAGARPSGD